jgi:hypothetical protein
MLLSRTLAQQTWQLSSVAASDQIQPVMIAESVPPICANTVQQGFEESIDFERYFVGQPSLFETIRQTIIKMVRLANLLHLNGAQITKRTI